MSRLLLPPALLAAAALGALSAQDPQDASVVLLEGSRHLGDDSTPEWPEAPAAPERGPLVLPFTLPEGNPSEEWTLSWRQRHVDNRWEMLLNGHSLGFLPPGADRRQHSFRVPAGVAREGANELRLQGNSTADDFTFGELVLDRRPFHQVHQLGRLEVQIEGPGGGGLPSRLSLVGPHGGRPELHPEPGDPSPLRPGVAYTVNGRSVFWLPEGGYALYASRGVEWSRSRTVVQIRQGETTAVRAALERQFETEGFVAADTHIHTLTFSGHGDASLDERLYTLAGEGVELAIATDHNHQTDYGSRQAELGQTPWYTSVTGNEVTTENGHFNAFPLPPGGPLPLHEGTDWRRQIADMRAKGARAVVLNHPRWPVGSSPFDHAGLDELLGRSQEPLELSMDAVEVFNSTTPEVHPDLALRDWFSLWNAGALLTGVGSSDSHTVGDSVGQGRTYLRSSARQAGDIDVAEACDSLVAGAASGSLGLYTELRAGGRPVMGELLPEGEGLRLQVRVAAPHWARAEQLSLYRDGELIEERRLPTVAAGPTDLLVDFQLPPMGRDSWVAAVVRGPKVEEPFWNTSMPYSAAFTNPVRLDDGDGVWKDLGQLADGWLEQAPAGQEAASEALQALDLALLRQVAWRLRQGSPSLFQALAARQGRHQAAFARVSALFPPADQ